MNPADFGIVRGEAIERYHAFDAVSSTMLLDMRPCERYYYLRHVAKTLPREDKKEFDLGTGAHLLILEGRAALEARTVMQPATYPGDPKASIYDPKTGLVHPEFEQKPWHNGANFCKRWNAEQAAAGRTILTASDFDTIDRMAKAVEENRDAVALLTGGESEVTFRVQHPAFAVQCRADHWHELGAQFQWSDGAVCVDLKTCDSIESFKREYFNFRYYYRAAFYREVIADCIGSVERPAFVFVAVEKNPPFRCEVFEPTDGDLEVGRCEVLADLKRLRECIEANHWPNSRLGIQTIELSEWQRKISADRARGLFAEMEVA